MYPIDVISNNHWSEFNGYSNVSGSINEYIVIYHKGSFKFFAKSQLLEGIIRNEYLIIRSYVTSNEEINLNLKEDSSFETIS